MTGAAEGSGTILSLRNVTKKFGGVTVLDNVSLDFGRGEIRGLIGENGAGKSTAIKIIAGIYSPDAGSLILDGVPVNIPDYISAKKKGIALVPQEFNLINTLTVFENIFLGNEIRLRSGLLDKKKMRTLAARRLESLEMPVGVNRPVRDLSVSEKQMVEIAKALMLDARFLIMDEPTTTLTGLETETLFAVMRDLKSRGVTLVFVSHKLAEIKAVCDSVTVLRDGKLVGTEETSGISEEDIARKMVGRGDFAQVFSARKTRPKGSLALEVAGLSVSGLLHDVSFSLHKGEILGFAGLVGSGRTELAEAVMGLRRINAGTVSVGGRAVRIDGPARAVRHALAYISEDRQGKGIVQDFNVAQNISLISLKNYAKGIFFIDKKAEKAKSETYVKNFNIAAASRNLALRYLSGGNQQKTYLSRWLDTNPAVLILDEPTRGIDIGAKREFYGFIRQLADRGIACWVISSEREEIIGLCDRVCVMRKGTISGCLEGNEITEEEIMFYATGLRGKKVS